MSDLSNFRIALDDQLFFINSTPIAGVQSLQFDTRKNLSTLRHLGQKKYNFYANGIQGGTVSISRSYVTDDLFLPLTGISGFNGYIVKTAAGSSSNYSFASGYLTSYSLQGGINDPVQMTVNVDVFGNLGTLVSADHNQIATDFSNIDTHGYVEPVYKFAHPHYTSVTCDNVTSNRLQNFEINIQVPRQPTYYLGKTEPDHVEINGPISVNYSLQYEIDNYTLTKAKNKSTSHELSDVSITLKTSQNQTIKVYSFNNMELVNESLSSSNNGNVTVDAEYQTYI